MPKDATFVSGFVRSGTTWTARMIALADEKYTIAEPFNILRASMFASGFKNNYIYLNGNNDNALKTRVKNMIGLSFTVSELGSVLGRQGLYFYPYTAYRFINHHFQKARNRRPVIHDPMAFFSLEWLDNNFDLDMILLVRHPAAVIQSQRRMKWGYNFKWLADQEELLEEKLKPFKKEILEQAPREFIPWEIETQALVWNIFAWTIAQYRANHPHWYIYRHEDLAARPVKSFRALYDKLSLDFGPKVETHIKRYTGDDNPALAEKDKIHTLKRDSKKLIKNWKKKLSEKEIEEIRARTEDVAKEFYGDEDW